MIRLKIGDQEIEIPFTGKAIGIVAGAALLLVGGLTSYYQVEAEEEAVVMRFGKYIKTSQPGLHFRMPFGIDSYIAVAVRRQLKQEFGFSTPNATNPSQTTGAREAEQVKHMVTGDLNAALVEWVIQYRIDDPTEYLFNVRNADENSPRRLRVSDAGDRRRPHRRRSHHHRPPGNRSRVPGETADRRQRLHHGHQHQPGPVEERQPTAPVQASFNEVNQAQQEREKAINVANGTYNQSVPKARGEADQKISEAQGYATQRINEAEGDAARFTAMFTEYQKAPEVTKRRIYLETMQDVIPQLGKKVIIDEDAQQILPLLPLGGEAR